MVLPEISPNTWLSLKGIDLIKVDKTMIMCGEKLNDMHIDFAQAILTKTVTTRQLITTPTFLEKWNLGQETKPA